MAAWPAWTALQPALGRVEDPRRLREWAKQADPGDADDVAYGLAWLASTEGGHDRDAARALAWLLVPGASYLAGKLRTLSVDIDHMVAAELSPTRAAGPFGLDPPMGWGGSRILTSRQRSC